MATKTPLTILLLPPCDKWDDERREWAKAGHILVHGLEAGALWPDPFDLIMGEKCWRMTDAHKKYAATAIKAAQAKRKGKK